MMDEIKNRDISLLRDIISSITRIDDVSLQSIHDKNIYNLFIGYKIKENNFKKTYEIPSNQIFNYFPKIDTLFPDESTWEKKWTISFVPWRDSSRHVVILTIKNESDMTLEEKRIEIDGPSLYKIFKCILDLSLYLFIFVEITYKQLIDHNVCIFLAKFDLISTRIESLSYENLRKLLISISYAKNTDYHIHIE